MAKNICKCADLLMDMHKIVTDLDENGFNKFEQEQIERQQAIEIVSGELEEYYLTEWPHDIDNDFAF